MPRILDQSEIKQPTRGLIVEDTEEDNPILGGVQDIGAYLKNKFGESMPILFSDGDCTAFIENYDLQRNGIFDPYDCVTASHQGALDVVEKRLFNLLKKQSRRFTAIKSGTIPNQGNSNTNVEKSIIFDGMVPEDNCVSMTPTMTQDEFFKLDPSVHTFEDFRNFYEVHFWAVPTSDGVRATRINLYSASLFSAIIVSVDGHYEFDADGNIISGNQSNGIRSTESDSHDVFIGKLSPNGLVSDLIMDSENPHGLEKFSTQYDYHYPVGIYLKKKVMYQLIKEDGSPAVYLFCSQSGNYYSISDSEEIPGGDLLKVMSGSYAGANIKHVPTGTIPLNKIIGSVRAVKN